MAEPLIIAEAMGSQQAALDMLALTYDRLSCVGAVGGTLWIACERIRDGVSYSVTNIEVSPEGDCRKIS